jgi:hypothetical protein
VASARKDHRDAWQLLSRQAVMASMPGIQIALGDWWQLEAQLSESTRPGEYSLPAWDRALGYYRRAVELWSGDSIDSLEQLANCSRQYASALRACGKAQLAKIHLAESDAIRAKIAGRPANQEAL